MPGATPNDRCVTARCLRRRFAFPGAECPKQLLGVRLPLHIVAEAAHGAYRLIELLDVAHARRADRKVRVEASLLVGGQRAVTNGAGKGSVSAFHDGKNGVLTSIGGSPYADNQTAPCWVTITPNGKYLFTVNTGSGFISSYGIADNGVLSLLGGTAFKDAGGLRPFDITATPNGQYAYTVDAGHATVSAFAGSAQGSLSELVSSPIALPTGA
ncbi:MAG TPA: beta-propeller fold lactonase family protein, partial [Ktedonobacterales bacterium]|nr:beta-propeller fold lactonase family protein [Ktedonobacterales bacterium]